MKKQKNRGVRASLLASLLAVCLVFPTCVPAETGAAGNETEKAETSGADTSGNDAEKTAETDENAETEKQEYTLQQVVVLSRHNIRSPLSEKGSMIREITPHEWFTWTSNPGELSLRGAMLETTMGQYFRLWLEKEGLFPENYIPKDGAVRFYANALQRTQATAHYFSTGLLPVAVTPVERHEELAEPDNTFLPLVTFMNDAFEQAVREETAQRGGGENLAGYQESLNESIKLLIDVADMNESEAYRNGDFGDLLNDETVLNFQIGEEPSMSGPIKTAAEVADALLLQYYEEPDEKKAAFGHDLTEEDWKTIGAVRGEYEEILFGSTLLAPVLAHPMLKEIYAELNAQGRKFSFLCGHDSTILSSLAALGAEDYTLPGAIEPTTPIGVKLVFERWADTSGKSFYKVNLVYQSVEQLRSFQPLSLDVPPMIVPVSFKGVNTRGDGMIPEKDLMDLFQKSINRMYELEEEYTEDELENTA